MATTVNGTKYNRFSDYPKIYETDFFTYVATSTDTAYTLTLTAGITIKNDYSVTGNIPLTGVRIDGTGQTYKSAQLSAFSVAKNSSVTKTAISSFSWSWTKTHSAQSVTIASYAQGNTGTKASKTFTIPAKTSYIVSYNVNGGTGSIGNSTKWYGETLTLTTSKPVKSGYTFKGWATSAANAGTCTTTTTYAGNAPATFYATWELTYSKPTITNLKVERCDVNGDADDEGTYARVSFDWSVFRNSNTRYYGGSDIDANKPYKNNSATCSIDFDGQILTPTLDGASGSYLSGVIGDGTYDVDTQYPVSVTISDTQEVQSAKTTTVTGALAKAAFPMDFNADATAVGFFCPAPDDGSGIYIRGKSILDIFYPVGSYYETSDTSFNPNTSWGGTWSLETEGQVHVSSGNNYHVNGALTNVSDGGATSRTVATTKLTAAQSGVPSHGHGHSLKLPGHQHHFNNSRKVPGIADSATWASYKVASGSTTSGYFISRGTNTLYTVVQTDGPDTTPAITGSVSNNTAAGAAEAHGHGSIDTRQPFIVVNRWHRTA